MEVRVKFLLLLIVGLSAGCQTTVGNYLGNRARDFGRMFRLQVGAGVGFGVSVKAAGITHAGLAMASYTRRHGLGWNYGEGYAFGSGDRGFAWEGEVNWTLLHPPWAMFALFLAALSPEDSHIPRFGWLTLPYHWEIEGARESTRDLSDSQHVCWFWFPGVLAMAGPPYNRWGSRKDDRERFLWTRYDFEGIRRARIHAFDIEGNVYLGIVYARFGFSPGELVDFLLGWFGVDIAGDDRALEWE